MPRRPVLAVSSANPAGKVAHHESSFAVDDQCKVVLECLETLDTELAGPVGPDLLKEPGTELEHLLASCGANQYPGSPIAGVGPAGHVTGVLQDGGRLCRGLLRDADAARV